MKDYTIISEMTTEQYKDLLQDMNSHYIKIASKFSKTDSSYSKAYPFDYNAWLSKRATS